MNGTITLEAALLISIAAAFATSYLAIPYFMRFFTRLGVVGTDQQKREKPVVPQAGGIPVFFGFMLGMLLFIAITQFAVTQLVIPIEINLVTLFAALLSTSIIAMVGFFDDINVRPSKVAIASDAVDYRVGLKQWQKPLLTLWASLPLIAARAGTTLLLFPLLGVVNVGIWYPLIIVPIAVVCVSNAANMLAGMNGLESGMTSVMLIAIGAFLLSRGEISGAVIALCAAAALIAFLKFNWYPAKMLPGDSLTYFAGAAIVSSIIIGNAEKLGILLFLPWVTEAFLKLRGKFQVRSLGDLQRDGTLKAPYEKIYALPHLLMKLPYWLGLKKGVTEKQITIILIAGEIVLALGVLTFYWVLFPYG